MARNRVVVEQVICDVCGKESDDAAAVTLGWGKEQWELDLCTSDHDSIGGTFDDWIAKGRKVSGRAARRPRSTGAGGSGGAGSNSGGDSGSAGNGGGGESASSAIREWGQANGWTVGAKGRISRTLREAYEAATR